MGNQKNKRKRSQSPPRPSHCFSCNQKMELSMCSIPWHAVYVSALFKDFVAEEDRMPTKEELEEMDESVGSDPCETCCCYACGSRKARPGDVCC